MPIARGVATCSKQSTNLLYGYGRELLKNEEYRSNSQQREFFGMQRYTSAQARLKTDMADEAPEIRSKQSTALAVPNRPLLPRAEGEMAWQPEKRFFATTNSVRP